MTYAGFWKRVVAFLIDLILLLIIGGLVGGLLGMLSGVSVNPAQGADPYGQLLGFVVGWLYYAALESSDKQATIGKMALGIRVTDLHGQRIGFARATGRHFGKIISGLILLIGYIMVAFTPKKQGLHDILAGCLVANKA